MASGPLADFDQIDVGGDFKVDLDDRDVTYNFHQYWITRVTQGDYQDSPAEPWDMAHGTRIDVLHLREKLQEKKLARPVWLTVTGTLFPCALLAAGWWDRVGKKSPRRPPWRNRLQQWLFYGFDQWGPSWDFSWNLDLSGWKPENGLYVAQLGDSDEADSIPVVVPREKAVKLRDEFLEQGGSIGASVSGLVGHREHFIEKYAVTGRQAEELRMAGGLLDYCIWIIEDEPKHFIDPGYAPDLYSGYLWKCVAPKSWLMGTEPSALNEVYFVWEHTNFLHQDAVRFGLETLEHKIRYIEKMHGDVVLLQKSSALVPGQPSLSTDDLYKILMCKKGRRI